MNSSLAGVLQLVLLVAVLAVCYKPLGDYMARVFTSPKHLRVEKGFYRVIGIDPDADQRWGTYARSMLAFSGVCVLFLYLLERIQEHLPYANGQSPVPSFLAWNTAASFVTNTNWQNYSGESTMGYTVQMAGLAVQNFVSAAVGIVVVIALIRGFVRTKTDRLGNFWVDTTRIVIRVLLPISIIGGIILAATGVIDNFNLTHVITTLSGGQQTVVGGPVASQEVIKELGNNGGGFFNANSAHPFENPNGFSNWFEIFLLLVIPFALPRTFGKMVGDNRQGYLLVAVMGGLLLCAIGGITFFEWQHAGTALRAAGGAMEGKEVRFGIPGSSLFGAATTTTSTGAVNSFFDSYTPFGSGIALFDLMLGEVIPGGVGAGLYGLLMLSVLTVFVGGLMVGRTPEYIGKKIRPTEMKWAALYILSTPASALIGAAMSLGFGVPQRAILNSGPHGLTEVVYAFTSMANNNGSAFAGLGTNTGWYNLAGGAVMLVARFAPEIFVLALGGSLARQQKVPASAGTLETHTPLFAGLLIGVIIILVGLTYFPALALGPFAEGLH
ncbi:MAG: potassium-transporting ATPase potassium-binding subunit [Trebonia sp.]|jgi:K+-transporting ATPase ATPase A chain|nr:potassium-transporting ATPase potassium-binding subunit [Trebonia sp.]